MMNLCSEVSHIAGVELFSAIKVLIVGIFFGSGLPILYAVGVKLYSFSTQSNSSNDSLQAADRPHHQLGPWGAYVCFFIVGVVVACGIFYLTRSTWERYI